ncbi:NAD(P)/FAD-dependent oxidoreductase [Humisphaera borealis]|uniref:FAD-dependent oxidoreductase n=1 Tax=Humisphaera borealis TaxID=2807512 RepID=A0A7M2WZP6_9BACT|nr:FAD-dependent oxidoreductase [Humisphaera borealis]QOV90987.1 FAD-dependent oxidoreductase [Humisphaera borealis]
MKPRRVAIVGAGVIGLCAALYCRRRGFDVTVVDRRAAIRTGCSFGNAGMIVPSHFIPLAAPGMVKLGLKWMWNPRSPFYIKPRLSWDLLAWGVQFWKSANRSHVERSAPVLRDLHLLSRSLYEQLAAEPGADFGFTPRGLLMLCKTSHGLEEESHAAIKANELGIPAEVLDAAGVGRLEPHTQTDVAGGVFYPRDCHLSPSALMAHLEKTLAADGVELCWESQVERFNVINGRLVSLQLTKSEGGDSTSRADGVSIEFDELVVAGGIGSTAIGRDLGLRLPMQAGKGYSLTLDRPRQSPTACAILTEARVAVTPMGGRLRFGGTMEMAGIDERINASRVAGIVSAIPRYYPAFQEADFAGLPAWHGLRPCPPDGMPYLGRSRRHANVIVATGHAMMGISLAPATGQLVAALASGDTSPIDLATMRPDRFD